MIRLLISALMLVFLLAPAGAQTVSPKDQTAFQAVITGQLEAFKKEDGKTAFSFAAPFVQGIFQNPDTFMSMVKRGYQPIYKNSGYKFGTLAVAPDGRPIQHVILVGVDGKRYEAIYAMQQQPDGSWKIAGVQMIEIPGVEA